MFWKRKSKKQEGQEATDSAAEVAEDTTEETHEAVESEDKDAKKVEKSDSEETEKAAVDVEDENGESKDESSGASGATAFEADDEDEVEEVGVAGPDSDGITRVRTAGTFEFGDEKFEVLNNTWIIEADKDGVIVIDPAHDAEAIMKVIGDREVYLVACTNGYSPHIGAALTIAEETEADIALHPREMRAWRRVHGAEHRPEIDVEGGGALDVGDLHIDVLALPGTSPGTVGYYVSQLGAVFSGDTLLKGSPGQVGDTYLDYTTQLASIGENLLTLPPDTRVLPDRGPSTTVEAENKNFDAWV
ncbi:MBL fold metallo-hydrolase [Nocardiopsis alkaliphila]|uniref:MBL fold metallo-hydrolase n=1 Tax=Nocardiopsis alkaliphila TaxID=225762 RepID=UPI00034638D9|nr:MBL fold metallo-hydrolase [Nocardiopsis alkaliphila]